MAKAVATKKKPVKMVAKKAVEKAPAPKKATKKNSKKAVKKVSACPTCRLLKGYCRAPDTEGHLQHSLDMSTMPAKRKRQTAVAVGTLPPGPKVGGSHSLGP